ncbi:MAG: tRNA (adenosine(37)-N6)-threonylcarbamoyltransferase complex ATPase subunit type 1 TsaE [Deltaproteobacteria bacterium RIFOXYD12_FULL_57_12]|nr:MAG: tRNA (adenosine(37)-N6)-threonylcarbamoyltransferase complex ATPase subunit type 1 TsaE [Deltaproteobacteria bacterium RIFOXYD12_FULL_57_12]
MSLTIDLPSLAATVALGRCLGGMAAPGDVITLAGSLGAGKTTLTQAIGRAAGVPESCYITSPSFSLLHEYPGRLPVYHMDLYRLADFEELELLGFEEYLYGVGLCVVEWPEMLGPLCPAERLAAELIIVSPESRRIILTAHGSAWKKRLAELVPMV